MTVAVFYMPVWAAPLAAWAGLTVYAFGRDIRAAWARHPHLAGGLARQLKRPLTRTPRLPLAAAADNGSAEGTAARQDTPQ